jgi:hypothetical protein
MPLKTGAVAARDTKNVPRFPSSATPSGGPSAAGVARLLDAGTPFAVAVGVTFVGGCLRRQAVIRR